VQASAKEQHQGSTELQPRCSRARVNGSCIRAANAALQQEEQQSATLSGNHAFIAYARPVTIT
tara:strand:+ start:249 stop:437 length:189 start_codon:yes stop_codon:yes gene_type:complete